MINLKYIQVTLALAATALLVSSCSINSKEPDGSELAAQSCTTDLLIISASSKIVPVGLINNKLSDNDPIEIKERVKVDQSRSVLSARAAATNKYWQPLADAWALEEALARAILQSLNDKYYDSTGVLVENSKHIYDGFVSNVNIDFAAVTKDTYCRIAFVKQNIDIKYEN